MFDKRYHLLASAAVLAGLSPGAASAQFVFPTATLHGAGSSVGQVSLRQVGDCYGLKQVIGFGVTSGSPPEAQELFDFDFNTPSADTIGNRFDCAGNSANLVLTAGQFGSPRIVQPNVAVRFLSTGSGQGITAWLNNRLSTNVVSSPNFPIYTSENGFQFGLSDTALSSANLTTYNASAINPFNRYPAAATAATLFGPAIQIPAFIIPIAVAYDPVYAKERNGGGEINEYRFIVGGARADGSGGLKLTRTQYCGIFNGTITNWNQLPANVVNKDFLDPAPFDVPIRLVGPSQQSGTTSLFTRAVARQCGGRFNNSENRLPYDASVQIAGTAYVGVGSTINPTNSLSGAFFDKGSNAVTIGTEITGLFGVANGSDGVAEFIDFHPVPGGTIGDRSLNGRIGFSSADQLLPATLFSNINSYGLNSASLQINGAGTTYAAPDARSANIAFFGLKPPQSKGEAGAYCTSACTGVGGGVGDRANPLDWVQIADKSVSLAAPVKGYPIIGTSNVLLYTCYATPERRQAVNGFFSFLYGKTGKDFNNQAVDLNVISALNPGSSGGLFATIGLTAMPNAWRTAIAETFFKASVQQGITGQPSTQLGLRNLWIQDRIPTTPTGSGSMPFGNSVVCADRPGA